MRISFSDADFDDADRLIYNGELFTGVAVEDHLDGVIMGESTYLRGIQDGPERGYRSDGTLSVEHIYRTGIIVRVRRWHENGQLALEKHNDSLGRLISEQRWDEDGNAIG